MNLYRVFDDFEHSFAPNKDCPLGFQVKEWFHVALLMTTMLAGSNNVFKVVENLKSRHNKGCVQLLWGMCLNMQLSLNMAFLNDQWQ